MSGNVTLNPGAGGSVINSDQLLSDNSQIQVVKLSYGADGYSTRVSSTTPLPVKETQSSTATTSSVASSASSVQLLASNSARYQATFYNDSTQVCYIKLGTTASTTDFTVKLDSGGYYELPFPIYTGRIDAIWASANGSMRITELTL